MKLYRKKIPTIAKAVVDRLANDGDVEILSEKREEAEKDLIAIMDEYRRRDYELRERVRDHMAKRSLPYSEQGRTRKRMAEQMGHPTGEDVERYLTRQFLECMLMSPNIEEVYEEDQVMHRKVIDVLRSHDVDEQAIREEAMAKVKNVQEGTVDYEIALQKAVQDVKRSKDLI
ncbi:MAG: DUF507 family protein [Myxococcota bacterium]